MKNCGDNVFGPVSVGPEEIALVEGYLGDQDFAANTRRAVVQDLRKFAAWFSRANAEPFCITGDDQGRYRFQGWPSSGTGQAVATINRALVTLRRFFGWLVEHGHARPILSSRSRNCGSSNLPPRAWSEAKFGGCCGKSNCGRTFGPVPSSHYSYTPAAGSGSRGPGTT